MIDIEFLKGDISKMKVDGIVNAANNTLLGGGGVDGAIHRSGGPTILEQCKKIGGCPTGEARITTAGDLDAMYVIHTVGPIYEGGDKKEAVFLKNAYENSLKLAEKYNLKSLAFPFISAGAYNYPKKEAAKIAKDTVSNFRSKGTLEKVYFVLFSDEDYNLFKSI